jgi:hypothetical protein
MKVMYWNCTCPMSQTNRFSEAKRDFIGQNGQLRQAGLTMSGRI